MGGPDRLTRRSFVRRTAAAAGLAAPSIIPSGVLAASGQPGAIGATTGPDAGSDPVAPALAQDGLGNVSDAVTECYAPLHRLPGEDRQERNGAGLAPGAEYILITGDREDAVMYIPVVADWTGGRWELLREQQPNGDGLRGWYLGARGRLVELVRERGQDRDGRPSAFAINQVRGPPGGSAIDGRSISTITASE